MDFDWIYFSHGYLKLLALILLISNLFLYFCHNLRPSSSTKLHLTVLSNVGWSLLLSHIVIGYTTGETICTGYFKEFVVTTIGAVLLIITGMSMLDDYAFLKRSRKRIPAITYSLFSCVAGWLLITDSSLLYTHGLHLGDSY